MAACLHAPTAVRGRLVSVLLRLRLDSRDKQSHASEQKENKG